MTRAFDVPKAEEISHFFLARVVSNVLHLEFNESVPEVPMVVRDSLREQRWTTCCAGGLFLKGDEGYECLI